MAGELGRDMACGRGMHRQIGQDRGGLRLAVLPVRLAHDRARARLMHLRHEGEVTHRPIGDEARRRAAADPADRPAGHRAGEFGHVRLGIAGAHAERVQLHDLAGEVFVEAGAAAALGAQPKRAVGADRHRLIEVDQHRRMPLDGEQHVGEAAHDVRADRLILQRAGEADQFELVGRSGEMVRPEMHQPFGEGRRRGERGGGAQADEVGVIVLREPPGILSRDLLRAAFFLRGRWGCHDGGRHVGRHRRNRRRGWWCHDRRRSGNALPGHCGLPNGPLFGLISGDILRHRGAGRGGGQHGRGGLIGVDLVEQPPFGIAGRLLPPRGPQAKPVHCYGSVRHHDSLHLVRVGIIEVCRRKPFGQVDVADQFAVARDGVAVGHAGDEVGDVAAAGGLFRRHVGGPFGTHRRGIVAIGGEQAADDTMRGIRRRELARVVIKVGVHEAFEVALLLAHRRREATQRLARCAHVIDGGDARRGDAPARFLDQVVDHHADLAAHQLMRQPARRDVGEARTRRIPAARDDRHREQLVERQQPGAQAVVDVVVVVSDIVGDRGDLRLQAGVAGQPGWRTGPLCLASPSSISHVRLRPSKRG
ncbi:hypothetical protein WR25_08953 [Diploscapter pachys]|uniref:Uncharacterized protein n=1 Tax=Diploscapter pachys TaxID=2018661 RepID=A0A2A2KER1_9BILA|nr:hypothetical protein WR25_08953 [Diploscapter pachys]